ncbi:unnamed protein product [Clonostachys rhizophaga]|uniref:50S ribosomal protein L14 n=1 Tax=Clonostachys rhizophaga TaxID=160324 RepID=A0A9N9V6J5_9HYPO|nr:unnamed protein product [Clonostachys rhizophaga]
MIQLKTVLNCIDNSGAALVECALVIGQKRAAQIASPSSLDRIIFKPTDHKFCLFWRIALGHPANQIPRLGDRIVVVVKEHRGASASGMAGVSAANKVKRGDIRHAVVVRTRYPVQRRDGSCVKFDDNACVLLNKAGDPVGSRINGVVGAELKRKKWSKILSMAPSQA